MAKQFRIEKVESNAQKEEFVDFPSRLYKNDPLWNRPIDIVVHNTFDKAKNKLLKEGNCCRWLLKDEFSETVGRIGAYYNTEMSKNHDQPTGGMGFFDCVDNQEAANMLFDTAKNWLESEGMEAMDGPVNLGMRDEFWGCLVKGFEDQVYNMPYNFPYYADLYENYGFQKYFGQCTYKRDLVIDKVRPIVERIGERILKDDNYTFKTIVKGDKKFASDFCEIYNKAWASFSGVKEIQEHEAEELLKEITPIMDEQIIIYCYHKGKPIGFSIMIPDIGQITRKFNGKFNWYNKLRLIYELRYTKTVNRMIGKIFGVVPEYQNKGVECGLICFLNNITLQKGFPYRTLELNWIGDFNPVMMKVCDLIGTKQNKTHNTYRYLFDRSKPFKEASQVNV